jgi:sodium/proline symporter
MSAELFPAIFTGVFLVIVLAAIMSTVDSLLILASSAVVRDVVQKIFDPDLSEARLSLYGKLTTVVIGAGALVFALRQPRMIFWFILFAWSGLASAFTPVVLCSLFWKRTTRVGAIAGMLAGFLTAMIWAIALKQHFYDLYEMIPGFAAGFLVTIVVSLLTEPPEGADDEFDEVWQSIQQPWES